MGWGDHVLFGLRKVAFSQTTDKGTTYADPFFLPAPEVMDSEEQQTQKAIPGGDVIYENVVKPKSLKFKFKWNALNLEQQAAFTGATFTASGSTPNRTSKMVRKTTDIAGDFKVDGLVKYIGNQFPNGEYHLRGWLGTCTKLPKWSNQYEDNASIEMEMEFLERADGEWYEMEILETGTDIPDTEDTTVPAVSSVTPADNATGVTASDNVVYVWNVPVRYRAEDYAIVKIDGSTVVDWPFVGTISEDGLTVTLNPTANYTATKPYMTRAAGAVARTGVVQTTVSTSNFTVT